MRGNVLYVKGLILATLVRPRNWWISNSVFATLLKFLLVDWLTFRLVFVFSLFSIATDRLKNTRFHLISFHCALIIVSISSDRWQQINNLSKETKQKTQDYIELQILLPCDFIATTSASYNQVQILYLLWSISKYVGNYVNARCVCEHILRSVCMCVYDKSFFLCILSDAFRWCSEFHHVFFFFLHSDNSYFESWLKSKKKKKKNNSK